MIKKILFSVLFAFLTFSYADVKGADVKGSNMLVTAWPVNVGSLNPHQYNPHQMFAQVMVYDSLVRYDGQGLEPSLAKSWKVSDDGKTYVFSLKENIKFSDGTSLDSFAIAQNFEAIMLNKERHNWLALVSVIDGWETPNKDTFILKLKSPYLMTLHELSLPRPFRVLAPSAFMDGVINTNKGIKKPIGTGPWVLSESKLGQYDIFNRNEYYWGKKPAFDSLKILVLPDPNSRIIALETDKVDILLGEGSFSLENFVRLSKDSDYVAKKSEARLTNMLAMNSHRSATKDINVRKAISHAVDKEAFIKYILLDQEKIAHQFYNPALEYCDIGLVPFEYNVEKARQILEQAGWKKDGQYRKKDGKVLELDLHYMGTSPRQKAIAEATQADLMNVGIKLNLKAEENTVFANIQTSGAFDITFNKTWGPPYEPHSFTASMRAPSHADYQVQLGLDQKTQIDADISKIITETDTKEVAKLYKNILTTLHNEAVYLPFSYELDLALYKKDRFKNFEFGAMSMEHMFHTLEWNK